MFSRCVSLAYDFLQHVFCSSVFFPLQLQLDSKDGATVRDVDTRGVAAAAGLRPGDVITEVNGKPVDSRHDVLAAVESSGLHGGSLMLKINRNGQIVDVSLLSSFARLQNQK